MKRFISMCLITVFLSIPIFHANAESKLVVKLNVIHSYLNGFKPEKVATLGDEWTISIRARDDEGDPAAGSEVRIYRGKKQIAFGRVNSKGIANVQLPITRVGQNSLKVTVRDSNPVAAAELNLEFQVVRPKILPSVLSQPLGFWKDPQRTFVDNFATNVPALIQTGCKRYWIIESNAWPFAELEEIQKWGPVNLPRGDQAIIDTLTSESFRGWALASSMDDGTAPLIICDIAGVLNLFNG